MGRAGEVQPRLFFLHCDNRRNVNRGAAVDGSNKFTGAASGAGEPPPGTEYRVAIFRIQAQRGVEPMGVERVSLAGLDEARRMAARYAGELLSEETDALGRSGEWTVTVADEAGLTLFTVTLLWTGAPALDKPRIMPPLAR